MKSQHGDFGFHSDTPERAIIDLLFHYMVLCEYQLLDLQAAVRGFVDRLSNAVSNIDGTLTAACSAARPAFESTSSALAAGKDSFTREEVAALLAAFKPCVNAADAVQPDLYTFIECLSFEDIQSQRLDHLVRASNALNMGIIERLRSGLENEGIEEVRAFAREMARATRAMYTMPEERDVFDQVFYGFLSKSASKVGEVG